MDASTSHSAAYLTASVLSLLVVTCARSVRPEGPEPLAPAAPASTAAIPEPSVDAAVEGETPTASRAGDAPSGSPLDRFHAALVELERGGRTEPVRVAWLGDSHTAADFYPDAFRHPLQERYGNGGPGFIYVGFKVYRHSGAEYERLGSWATEPRAPSTRAVTDDGKFGLGGVRSYPRGSNTAIKLKLRNADADEPYRWEVHYRLPTPASRLVVRYGGRREVLSGATEPDGIDRYSFVAPAGAEVSLQELVGQPRVFGVIAERVAPGVVVDTLGINGARIDTPLAWNEEHWVHEMKRRSPTLVVLAYGSNEVGDRVAPFRYADKYKTLLTRVRAAAPGVECVILGLPDQAAPDWHTPERVSEIETVQQQVAASEGCAFVSTLSVMGGEGAFRSWVKQDPPLASPDRVHLTPRGYRELGEKVVVKLLGPFGEVNAKSTP